MIQPTETSSQIQVQVETAKHNQPGHACTPACKRLLHKRGDEGEGFVQEGEEEEEQGGGEEVKDVEGGRPASHVQRGRRPGAGETFYTKTYSI